MEPGPLFHYAPTSFDNTGSAPAPPAGLEVENRAGTLLLPSDYSSVALVAGALRGGTDYFGLFPSFETLRPDLFPGIFRVVFRVWGIAPLTNPWVLPDSYEFFRLTNAQGVSSAPFSVFDVNPWFTLAWGHFLAHNYPLFPFLMDSNPPLRETDLVLNAWGTEAEMTAMGSEPNGLYEIDRTITWYGRFAGFTAERDVRMLRPGYGAGVEEHAGFEPGGFARSPFGWVEPNYELRNPANPVPIPAPSAPEFDYPEDDGVTLFGTRPDTAKYRTIGLFVGMKPLEGVSVAGPLEILHHKRDLVQPLRG